MAMAISRITQLCCSGLGFCHGEFYHGNVRSRNVMLPKVHLPQKPLARRTSISSQNRDSFSSGESESLHSHDTRAEAECCGRREIGVASLGFLLITFSTNKTDSAEAGSLDKYLKKKKLDPLDTYVPTVLLAQSQFQEVDGKLGGEQKTYADARSLLRTGPAASLRTDIRAVAQYAAETGTDDGVASAAVDQCLSALEDLDSLMLQASRENGAPVERMRKDLTMTVSALDRLLATVPAPILEKAKAIAEAYKESTY